MAVEQKRIFPLLVSLECECECVMRQSLNGEQAEEDRIAHAIEVAKYGKKHEELADDVRLEGGTLESERC